MEDNWRRRSYGRTGGYVCEPERAMGYDEGDAINGMAMAEIVQKGSSNSLIAALVDDLKARATKAEPPQGLTDPEKCKEVALNHVRAVNDLINRKVAPEEGDEFKKWLLSVAERVAEASNEGGIFGFGGERISDAEKNALRQIAFTLGQPAR